LRGLPALGLALALEIGPVGAATGELPNLGPGVTVAQLATGGTIIVRPAQGAPVAAVELWFRAPSTGFGPKPALGVARLAAQVVAASKPIVGEPLGRTVSDVGGRLAITTYTDSVAVSAVVPAASARDIVKAMTTAFYAPVATEEGFRLAQRDVAQEALISNFDPEIAVRDAIFGELFASAPQRYSALGGPKDITALTFTDVKAFATRAFRSQNSTLVVSGDVDATIASAAVPGRPVTGDAAPEPPALSELSTSTEPVTGDFATPSGGYGWVGPPIADQREATAMDFIADYLFRPDDGYVSEQISAAFPDAIVVGQFITLHDPGVMFVAYSGKSPDALKGFVDAGFARVRKPLERPVFSAALDAFKYHLLSDLQTPTELADNYGWYSVEGSPEYAPGASGDSGPYFKAANSLTPEFVASVAEKYLGKPPIVVALRPPASKPKAQ
jgi:predicted Zn-dependent peptidase